MDYVIVQYGSFVLVAAGFEVRQLRAGGALSDVAPTLLKLMGVAQPVEMDGKSLF